jgi:ketosteroid isomerase-like protein
VSDADVELIERMYHAWNSGDVVALIDVFDAEVEVRPALGAFLASTVYRGHDGVAAWYEETYEPWAELYAEPKRFIDAGERIVVVTALRARVAGGQVDVEAELAQVVTVRDGKIVRLDGYEEPDAAFAAVGVSG